MRQFKIERGDRRFDMSLPLPTHCGRRCRQPVGAGSHDHQHQPEGSAVDGSPGDNSIGERGYSRSSAQAGAVSGGVVGKRKTHARQARSVSRPSIPRVRFWSDAIETKSAAQHHAVEGHAFEHLLVKARARAREPRARSSTDFGPGTLRGGGTEHLRTRPWISRTQRFPWVRE